MTPDDHGSQLAASARADDPALGEPPAAARPRADSLPPRPPLLASEALKDELAPVEPLRSAARVWCASLGLCVAAMGFAPEWAPQGKPFVELVSGVMLLAVAGLPLSYRGRAGAMVALAIVVGLAGVAGAGPASTVAYAVGEWGLLHVIAAAVVPAALLFRSRYRAYGGARPILAASLALALPLAAHCALSLDEATVAVQIASAIALVAIGCSLVGFMGSQTTIAGDYLAVAIIAAIGAQIATQAATKLGPASTSEWFSMLASAAMFCAVAAVGAVGLFQLLATRHWRRARDIDVHPALSEPPPAAPSAPSLTDTWSTRN